VTTLPTTETAPVDHDPSTPSTEKPTITFPDSAPRMSMSNSQRSDISSVSASDLPEGSKGTQGADAEDKKDKRRTRLGSIKGFVRRISDQSALSRSNSFGKPGSAKSPMNEVDEASAMIQSAVGGGADDKKKKRLSLQRGNSTK